MPRRNLPSRPLTMGTYGLHHDAARRVAIWPSRLSPMGVYGLYNDAARRVATVFEKWDCLIETAAF